MAVKDPSLVGKTIGGYEVIEQVGSGGMGTVWRARQISLDREVALKILAPALAENDEFVRRFQREARSIAKVNHVNILQVFDVGQDQGIHYIAMEFVDGDTVAGLLKKRGFLAWREAVAIIRQAAAGLAKAADAGIIHRDVKPDNLMLTAENIVKVSDFGLAKEMHEAEITQTGDLMGTPAYMSPEQCEGKPLDTRSDIYSLGGSFYRIVTGVLPFNAPTAVAMLYSHMHAPLKPARDYMPDIPLALDSLLTRMMAKDKDDRPATMQDLVEALHRILANPDQMDQDLESTLRLPSKDDGDLQLLPLPSESSPSPSLSNTPSSAWDVPAFAPASSTAPSSFDNRYSDAGSLVSQGDQYAKQGRALLAFGFWQKALAICPDDAKLRKRLKSVQMQIVREALRIVLPILKEETILTARSRLQKMEMVKPDDLVLIEKNAAIEVVDHYRRQTLKNIRDLIASADQEKALAEWDSLEEPLRDKSLVATMEHLRKHVIPSKQRLLRAQILLSEAKIDEACGFLKEAVSLDSNNVQAQKELERVQKLIRKSEQVIKAGYNCVINLKHEEAVPYFLESLSIRPDHLQTRQYLLQSCLQVAKDKMGHGDIEEAASVLRKVPESARANTEAQGLLKILDKRLDDRDAAMQEARAAFANGRYRTSVRLWSNISGPQAKLELSRSRYRYWTRRILPIACTILFLCAGVTAAIVLGLYHARQSAVTDLKNAISADRSQLQHSLERIDNLSSLPVVGPYVFKNSDELLRDSWHEWTAVRVNHLLSEKTVESCTQAESLLSDQTLPISDEFRAGQLVATIHAKALMFLHDDNLIDARQEFRRLQEVAAQAGVKLDNRVKSLATAVELLLRARLIDRNPKLSKAQQAEAKLRTLQEALLYWPEAPECKEQISDTQKWLKIRGQNVQDVIKRIHAGRQFVQGGLVAKANYEFEKAFEAASAILRDGYDWDAMKAYSEASWRKQAGKNTVFFLYPTPADPEMKRIFRAFAIDQYEWPNQAGSLPQVASWKDALKLAQGAGKDLPRRDEWLFAMSHDSSGRGRRFPWGAVVDVLNPQACYAQAAAATSGSYVHDRTPEGVYDLGGNLSEWVQTESGSQRAGYLGGNFNDLPSEVDPRKLRTERLDLKYGYIGFRAMFRWEIIRENQNP